jgi:hypothetical protein
VFPVEVEVTAGVVEAKTDKAAGTTLVTVSAGTFHGVKPDWVGTISDDEGKELGRFTILDVKQRTTRGATALPAKELEGKRVTLRPPPK